MHNETHFLLSESQAGIGPQDAPAFFRLRQKFERPREADVPAAVRRELAPFLGRVKAGQRIAITGSSRGIANLAAVLRECVKSLKEAGAQPFVVPAMGSHGGATAEGQVGVLAAAGITEDSLGAPIRSSMEVIQVGTTSTGFPVFQDRNASQADAVLVVNRVKPHTSFIEVVESGLCKMLVIGLGKQAGASKIHQQALRVELGRMVLEASRIILESGQMRFLGGLALVENAFHETAQVQGLPLDDHAALVAAEGKLLKRAYGLMARLPFEDLDGLIVDEMGKNISGGGMDSNVIGKKPGMTSPRIAAIFVRGLTEATHGNAVGIGNTDIMLRRLVEQIDFNSTYMNVFTAKSLRGAKLPMLAESELQAMQIMLNFRDDPELARVRLAWIRNTSELDELWASAALLDEVRANPRLEVLSEPAPLGYDGEGNLVAPRLG
jgi:antitoxin (DNA-binding transcriptional repressor) of toxin-antitoxin stability system